MKDFLKKHPVAVIATALGTAGGFLYWKFVGCKSGTCPIKSQWYLTMLWGGVMGYLLGSIAEDVMGKVNGNKGNTGSGTGEGKA